MRATYRMRCPPGCAFTSPAYRPAVNGTAPRTLTVRPKLVRPPSNQPEKFGTGAWIFAEDAAIDASNDSTARFLDPSHHHAQMLGLDHHSHAERADTLVDGV